VVVVVEALPVLAELLEAVLVDVFDDARRAPGDPAALLEALELALARVLLLALHEVVVVRPAAGADEEGRRHERRRGGANLLDRRDRVRQGSQIHEVLLIESGASGCVSWGKFDSGIVVGE